MEKAMSSMERMMAVLRGDPVDRIPYSFWSHLPEIDRDAERMAEATVKFVYDYDLDFIKTMPNGMYAIEDFGCKCDFSEVPLGGVAKLAATPIQKPQDWGLIHQLEMDAPALSRELRTVEFILKELKGKVPVLFTVFSPLTTAEKISGGRLRAHIDAGARKHLHKALDSIAQTTKKLSEKAIAMGVDGVFLATQSATNKKFSLEEYLEFGKHYDLIALEGAIGGWCNALHIHGDDIYFNELSDYPVQILNWHVWETAPDICDAIKTTDKCIMGGLKRFSITENKKDELSAQIWASLAQSEGRRHILTPGCVIRPPMPESALRHLRQTLCRACDSLL